MKIAESSHILHFSTDALPERDRLAMWREVFGRHVAKVEFDLIPNVRYFHTATLRDLPGISFALASGAGFSAARTRQLITDSNDDVVLTVNTEGVAHASQFGNDAVIGPSEGVILSSADLGSIRYPSHARFMAFRIPRKTINLAVNGLEAMVARRLAGNEALRLLTAYTASLGAQELVSPALRQACATHLVDLVTLAIGANRDATEMAKGRGLQAARLKAIKSDILLLLSNEELSVIEVARRHRVTPRYVQLLFEADGKTFSEYVVERRLDRAYRMLMEARFSDWTIGAIAFEVGFSNLSYFNRTFRRRYSATPSEIRHDVARKG